MSPKVSTKNKGWQDRKPVPTTLEAVINGSVSSCFLDELCTSSTRNTVRVPTVTGNTQKQQNQTYKYTLKDSQTLNGLVQYNVAGKKWSLRHLQGAYR
ncbi:unnamed protein product [Gongylonema pulchrum]|uniref:Transposase n=1 Tax=Gongylonema pulchrum TaxID=637853 RepID=A0A183ESA4_9BILA|nr:unnamed protein product [Gongylonema pulchrum]